MAKKSRKVFATTATAALVASAVAPIASSAAGFSDVKKPEYKEAIDALAQAGIINGYEDGTFKPENKVTRGEVAKVITLIRHLGEGTKTPFKDVKDGYWSTQYINSLYAAKLINGYENGTFKPEGNITRAEFAKLVVDAYGLTLTNAATPFTDVKAGNWATPYIQTAYANGLIKGVTASKFDPSAPIKRGDLALLLHRADSKFGDVIGNNFPGVELVKATNNTTVEVTFKEAVDKDVKAADFSIEGLTVSNAAVKQTDNKTVVLTTSTQKGGELYTVKSGAATLGKFKGVSAVIPTAVSVVDKAVQGKLGQEVTVKAQVTVAEGQSKAGIPVTFNVPGDNGTLHPTVTGEAVTDENGVATYSYTRYAAKEDSVTAYATGDRSKFSTGYVFWGVDTILAVEEVTKGETINNGANKTYKVTYKNPETGKPQANVTLNVSFAENLNVTPDKKKDATVNGVKVVQLSNGTAPEAAQITTDSKGEATFTVSGNNTEVTPVVFKAAPTNTTNVYSKAYSTSALQAKASKVKFAAVQADYTIEVTRDGGEEAAIKQENGRKYNIVVKDKDGKVAKNELVNVAFNEDLDRVISTKTSAKFVEVLSNGSQQYFTGDKAKQITVKTNDKGEASFVISSDEENDYATPVAWIDVNSSNAAEGKLDEGEPKTVAQVSFFTKPYLAGAELKSYNGNSKTDKFNGTETAKFKAELVNQSGKTISQNIKKVTYTVFNTGSSDITVGGKVVSSNRSTTVTYEAPDSTDLLVSPIGDKNASVKVVATGIAVDTDNKDYAFTAKEATATFTSTQAVADTYTSYVSEINTKDKEITFTGKAPVSYDGASFKAENGSTLSTDAFEKLVAANLSDILITYTKTSDGKVTFEVVSTNGRTALDLTVSTPGSSVVTNEKSFTITGTATKGSTVKVYTDLNNDGQINGSDAVVATGTAASDTGTFSVATPLTENAANNFVVVAYDTIGNYSSTVDVNTITQDSIAPTFTSAAIDSANKVVTLTFSESVLSNVADANALKAAITLSTDGTTFNSLGANDTVAITDGKLVITLESALSGNTNKIKVAANSLKDAANNALKDAVITDALNVTP